MGGRWLAGGKRSSRLSFTLAKLVRPLIKGALQTELGLGWEEKQQTEFYIDQVNSPLDDLLTLEIYKVRTLASISESDMKAAMSIYHGCPYPRQYGDTGFT